MALKQIPSKDFPTRKFFNNWNIQEGAQGDFRPTIAQLFYIFIFFENWPQKE